MRIGEFVALLNTTKDTVRHYEELNLITPIRKGNNKHYGEKDIQDFEVIMELKDYGISLKEIQIIFNLKHAFGCGDKQLVAKLYNQLTNHLDVLRQEEEEIHRRRINLHNQIESIKGLL